MALALLTLRNEPMEMIRLCRQEPTDSTPHTWLTDWLRYLGLLSAECWAGWLLVDREERWYKSWIAFAPIGGLLGHAHHETQSQQQGLLLPVYALLFLTCGEIRKWFVARATDRALIHGSDSDYLASPFVPSPQLIRGPSPSFLHRNCSTLCCVVSYYVGWMMGIILLTWPGMRDGENRGSIGKGWGWNLIELFVTICNARVFF